MKIQNTSIGSRLVMGFGIILIFMVLLGIASYQQANRLWKITSDMYNHPLQISNTSRDIKTDIDSIHILLKDIALDEKLSPRDIALKTNKINTLEAEVFRSFDIVYDRYPGSKANVDSAYNAFKSWKSLRDKVIRCRLQGDAGLAYSAYKIENTQYRDMMFSHIKVMVDNTTYKANSFFRNAENEKQQILLWIHIALISMFLISGIVAFIIYKSIRTPLVALTRIADRLSKGNYDVRSNYVSTNEIGLLSSAFNNLADSVQQENELAELSSRIAQKLISENDLRLFCKKMLTSLSTATNSEVAAIYFLNPEKSHFEHFESLGLDAAKCKSFSADMREGEFGAVITQKEIVRVGKIPSDTCFGFTTVTGHYIPRDMVAIPILQDNTIVAIISLASLNEFSTISLLLLSEIHFMITTRMHEVMAFHKITDISLMLDRKNKDLAEKSKELAMQAVELKEYNIELKIQKKQVDEANRFKSAFLSNMSHELRTPLNSVIALSGVLTRRLKNQVSDDEYNYLGIIEKNGKQLLSLINDILDLSRIESGKEEINISRFNVSSLVESIAESLEPIANGKKLRLINSIGHNLTAIESDADKCHHILQNVISNAIKFTEEGSVEISAKQKNNEIHISVHDTGIGIDPEYIALIFDEFRQADERVARKFGGSGLGLAIAKKYILLLGGSIDVQSKPGVGSTFTIKIPLVMAGFPKGNYVAEPELVKVQNPVTNTLNTADVSGKTILLVEDSEPQIIQMSYILEKNGYTVLTARNGKEALESIRISIPDAMILDLMMPEVDGFQVLDSIRSQPETSQIPVLILTAKHVTRNELFFLKGNHIHQIIMKGVVNRAELLEHIKTMMNSPSKTDATPAKRKISQTGKLVILVVEDNPDDLETVKALLEEKNEIIGAADSIEGLAIARTQHPDLVLLDITLPGLDGFAVFDELRKDQSLKHIPVVALTARAMKGDREQLLAYGFDGYISKPVDIRMMEETIEKVMGKSEE